MASTAGTDAAAGSAVPGVGTLLGLGIGATVAGGTLLTNYLLHRRKPVAAAGSWGARVGILSVAAMQVQSLSVMSINGGNAWFGPGAPAAPAGGVRPRRPGARS